jgi:hypothetical protein
MGAEHRTTGCVLTRAEFLRIAHGVAEDGTPKAPPMVTAPDMHREIRA